MSVLRQDVPNIDRSALFGRVRASGAVFVSIVAPAGYGKSRFARALLEPENDGIVTDCADLRGVADTVRTLVRGLGPFGQDTDERLARYFMALPRDGSADDQWLDVLEEALRATCNRSTLCIENAEAIFGRAGVAGILDRTIRAGGRRFVLCSRTPVALPALARVPPHARFDIGIEELRFTESEIAGLFDTFHLSSPTLKSIVQLSQGWPIAVLSFLRAVREGRLAQALGDIASAAGASGLGEYTLSEALGSLSSEARHVLAAGALLRRFSEEDLSALSDRGREIDEEFLTCPFVSRSGSLREVHPLAVAALAPLRDEGEALLCAAAARVSDPVRSAQLYLAAGKHDAAADVLDTSLATPFMLSQPSPETAALVASIEEAVLLRHPRTWNATWMLRAFTVSAQRMLFETRTVWAALHDAEPVIVRFGVGLALLNWTFFTGHMDEAPRIFDALERVIEDQPDRPIFSILLDGWKLFWQLRRGEAVEVEPLLPVWASAFATLPLDHAMLLYALPGPIAFFCGDRGEERRVFALSVELAFTKGSETIAAVAIVNAAFHAWLAGENALFASYLQKLREVSLPNVAPATSHFLGCATNHAPLDIPSGRELPYMRAYALIIAATREESAAAKRAALLGAIDAAVLEGQPWLLAFTWAALGLADPAIREEAFVTARRFADNVEYPHIRNSIEQLTRGTIPRRWPAIKKLVSAESPAGPILVRLGGREVRVGSRIIVLAPREAELLLALCLHAGPCDRRTLAAMLFTELEEKAGTNVVSVCVKRLRQRLGGLDLIESSGAGYSLRYRVHVDLLMLEDALVRKRTHEVLDPAIEEIVESKDSRVPQWVATSEWLAPYVRRYEAAIYQIRLSRASAPDTGEARRAHYGRLISAEDAD